MDFALTEEQKMIRNAAREFALNRLQPLAFDIDRNNEIPEELFRELGSLELPGLAFPESCGGSGAGYLAFVLSQEQIARGSSGVGMALSVNNLGLSAIHNRGSEEQKKRWIPRCCTGEELASFAFTEPDTGSDPKMLTSTLVRQGERFILNGTKRFISLADHRGPMVVFARDDEAGRPTAVVIDKFCDGYTLGESWNKTGVRGCHACDVLFRDIVLEESDILGSRGQGFDILLENIAFGKMGFCAESVGSSQECLDQSILYARTKTNRNLPIARFESMQLRLSDMAVKVEAARWLTYRLGYLADHRDGSFSFAAEAALAKRFVAEAFVDVAREAVQAHGSYGVIADFRVEMAYRDAIVGEIVEGTKDLQRRIIAGNLLN